jgi:hypothetical protein
MPRLSIAVNVAGWKLVRARREPRLLGVAWDEASPQALSTWSIGKPGSVRRAGAGRKPRQHQTIKPAFGLLL